ncbi:c-type cytochrome [Cruoricaptor ignavus]|nr:c-type cytochrome [Cruoricaptor ignavus]
MKKLVMMAALAAMTAVSCSKKETQPTESNVMLEEPKPETAQNGEMASEGAGTPEAEGEALVKGSDCLSCHKVDAKLVGPSYQDIAKKYTEADTEMLAQKIIEGGQGHWGDIPMTPHAGLSKENATKMVQYILSLK